MNEGENKAEVGVENLKPVVEVGSEQNVGEAVKDTNDFMNSEINKLKEETSAKLAGLENKEGPKSFNINDSDILEKLAKIAGCEVSDFPTQGLDHLKKMAAEGEDSEFYDQKTLNKFYMLSDGSFVMGNMCDPEVQKRGIEMGMRVGE